jgi:hypothetical protein
MDSIINVCTIKLIIVVILKYKTKNIYNTITQ